jgi:hypothetical protein
LTKTGLRYILGDFFTTLNKRLSGTLCLGQSAFHWHLKKAFFYPNSLACMKRALQFLDIHLMQKRGGSTFQVQGQFGETRM